MHVWSLLVSADDELLDLALALSEEDKAKADRFRTPMQRTVYVAAHGALRLALSHALACNPADLFFTFNRWGKPALAPPHSDLHFNLSHSNNHVLIALSRSGAIGVDTEYIAREPPYDISQNVFTKRECAMLEERSLDERRALFYALWTRKEALLKAVGCGLHVEPSRFETDDIHFSSEAVPGIIDVSWGLQRWWFQTLPSPPGFSSTMTVAEEPLKVALNHHGYD